MSILMMKLYAVDFLHFFSTGWPSYFFCRFKSLLPPVPFITLHTYTPRIQLFANHLSSPLQVLCLWPQLNLGLGVGPKSYLNVDNLFLTLPLRNFIRCFTPLHFSFHHSQLLTTLKIILLYCFTPARLLQLIYLTVIY